MSQTSRNAGSLIERAAEVYDFGAAAARRRPVTVDPIDAPVIASAAFAPMDSAPTMQPAPQPLPASRDTAAIDRVRLAEQGFIVPGAQVSGLEEEFRIVKRRLLAAMRDEAIDPARRQSVLVCSATSGEGKTFCAINLALSLSGEADREVLLIDGDFAKPHLPSLLGIDAGAGLIDAIADPSIDPEALVVATDIAGLSILPAGRRANNATELLASDRTREVLGALAARRPNRIMIFDSPPALLASPASVLAGLVGQLLMVVRADRTAESDLREAIGLLSACSSISLMLNAATLNLGGRRFGTYYGYGK